MPLTDNEIFFKEFLKQRRINMGAGNRERTKKFKIVRPFYPAQYERKYFKNIKELMNVFINMTNETLKSNLDLWIDSYNRVTKNTDRKEDYFDKEYERGYFKWIKELINVFINLGADSYNLVEKKDTDRKDDYSNDFRSFIDQLYDEQSKQFVIGAADKRYFISTIGYDVSDFNNKQWQKNVTKLIGTNFIVAEPWEAEVIATWSETNYTLIKSLSDEYIKKVNIIVSDGVQQGLGSREIKKEIRKINQNISNARSELIARDQVGKLNGLLTKRRQQEVGIDWYIWMTAGDERVRKSHRGLDGTVNKWGNPSVYSTDNGESFQGRPSGISRAEPGSEVRCRCDGAPFFDELIEITDKEIAKEQKRNLELGPSGF